MVEHLQCEDHPYNSTSPHLCHLCWFALTARSPCLVNQLHSSMLYKEKIAITMNKIIIWTIRLRQAAFRSDLDIGHQRSYWASNSIT